MAGAGAWDWDLRTGVVTWSDAYYTLYGLERDCVSPSYDHWLACVHPEDRDRAEAAARRAVASKGELNVEFRMAFKLQPVDLMPLAEEALNVNRPYADQFGVQLSLDEPLHEVWVNADPDRLVQVLTNLLSNAAKFSPAGTAITLRVSRHDGLVRVAISDCGPGIPDEFRYRVFQKFAQADTSDARAKGGTSLGLSICKAIVERLGDQIGFDSRNGHGTTFYFDLPEHANS